MEYKLETHLQRVCQESVQYEDLWATWVLNKRACSDALKEVVLRYPHFSMHDASHAEAVTAKIEMILGNRIAALSPTDTWLLLHAAYAHDLGMVVLWDEITELWEKAEFQTYLKSLQSSHEIGLRRAADFLLKKENIAKVSSWPLETYRSVGLVISTYFRGRHAQMSKSYIQTSMAGLELDLGHSNRIQPRLIKLLARICQLHTEPSEKILELEFQTNGYRSDYAHPRFIAVLLRLGDLLDVDNGRFNATGERAIGGLPESSVKHKEKHEATTHLLVTPEEIEFCSDCPTQQAYQETRSFINQLENELDFFTKYWPDIVPEGFEGYAPRLRKKELLLNGTPDVEGVADLKFEISQEKAFQVIEGTNIYKDKFVFIRELIQNALDATKLQLWQDLSSGTYQAWLGDKIPSTLQPFDVDDKIYQNYPIEVRLSTPEEGITQVEVQDRGTGISVETFKQMCQVGTSNSGSKEVQRAIQDMPSWLRPTAGFGIGLQSIFLLADSFEIDTNTGKEMFHAVVQSHRDGGYLQLQRTDLAQPRGTTVCIRFHMPDYFQYSMLGETQQYLECYLDPIDSQNYLGEVRVMESIDVNCGSTMFPVKVTCTEEHMEPLELLRQFPVRKDDIEHWAEYAGQYRIKIGEHCERIQVWDQQSMALGVFQFIRLEYGGIRVRFKGNEVAKQTPSFRIDGLSALIDVYGLDTKETITLDRDSLTNKGRVKVSEILDKMLLHGVDFLLKQFEDNQELRNAAAEEKEPFSLYTLWLLCSPEQRKKLPQKLIDKMAADAVILDKVDTHFEKKNVQVNSLIPVLEHYDFAILHNFDLHNGTNTIDYPRMCTILDKCADLSEHRVIADKNLSRAVSNMYLASLQLPLEGEPLWLYQVSEKETLMKANDQTRVALLKGLDDFIPNLSYNYRHSDIKAKRYAIPALAEYPALAVWNLSYWFTRPNFPSRCAYIIAPFAREDVEKRAGMSEDAFVEYILASMQFHMLIEFIAKAKGIDKDAAWEQSATSEYEKLIRDYCRLS